MNNIYTEQDLDKLIASVEETLAKAEVLSKAFPPKDDDQQADAAPAPEAAPADAAPAPEAAPDMGAAPVADQAAAPAPEAAPEAAPQEGAPADASQQAAPEGAPQGDEQALEGEQQDAPLSDEELDQIYSSMPPEELERHYSAIRQHMEAAYAKAEEDESKEDEESEEDESKEKEDEKEEMEKSEKVITLEAKLAEQDKALKNLAKAFEILAKPQRKAVTDIQFIRKSEEESGKKDHTKEEIKAWYDKTGPASLNKNERETINSFFLYGEGKEEIEKLINSKGGK